MSISLKIRDGLVEVDNKPYSVSELYVGGLLRGEVVISKSNGLLGEIIIKNIPAITYEYPGILVIGEWSSNGNVRVDVIERKKSFTVKYASTQLEAPEVKLILENTKSRLIVAFTPRRITLQCSNNVEVFEEPFRLVLRVRAQK